MGSEVVAGMSGVYYGVLLATDRGGPMGVEFDIRLRDHDGWTVLEVVGEIDLSTAPQLERRVDDVIEQGSHRLILDLTGVVFMDSTGLRALIAAQKSIAEHTGRLAIAAADGPVTRLLSITGVQSELIVHPTVEEAARS